MLSETTALILTATAVLTIVVIAYRKEKAKPTKKKVDHTKSTLVAIATIATIIFMSGCR